MKHWKKLIIGSVVLAVSVGAFILWRLNTEQATPPDSYVAPAPSEEKIDPQTYRWSGAPDEPKYIRLPTIGAEGFIEKVGVNPNNQVGAPTNIYVAGWFTGGAKPGQKGLSIIDGHVDGRESDDGIFRRLHTIKVNDVYSVELGNGSLKRYRVTKLSSVATAEAANILFSQDHTSESQLNLITCGGTFNQQSQQYEQRVIVVSELIE